MKNKLILLSILSVFFSNICFAEAISGQPAPNFSTKDINGKNISISDFKGKYVVLEWFNHSCPFVKKHYGSGNMQKLQKTYTDKGVEWISINSSAEGKEGYLSPEEAVQMTKEKSSQASNVILDPEGKIGHLYGAKSTPTMYVIDPKGTVIYSGAIDDNDSARQNAVEGAKNYVSQALDESMAGKPVSEATTEAYGCSVKYKS